MASPQRPEFHRNSSGDASKPHGERPGHPPAGRRARPLIALLIGVILMAVFFYWIAWGWGSTGGYWWRKGTEPTRSSVSQSMTGSGVAVLNASDKQSFIGQAFQLSNVPVQRKVSNRIFWIGANSQSPLLVVLNGNQNPSQFDSLTTGNTVNVAGTVVKAPPTPDAASQWPLNDPDLAQLEKEGVYIVATQFYRAPK